MQTRCNEVDYIINTRNLLCEPKEISLRLSAEKKKIKKKSEIERSRESAAKYINGELVVVILCVHLNDELRHMIPKFLV